MARYRNIDGDSGVAAYELGEGCIKVQFNDGSKYLYTAQSAGAHNINRMHTLAQSGDGLNAFINTHVKHRYASKIR